MSYHYLNIKFFLFNDLKKINIYTSVCTGKEFVDFDFQKLIKKV